MIFPLNIRGKYDLEVLRKLIKQTGVRGRRGFEHRRRNLSSAAGRFRVLFKAEICGLLKREIFSCIGACLRYEAHPYRRMLGDRSSKTIYGRATGSREPRQVRKEATVAILFVCSAAQLKPGSSISGEPGFFCLEAPEIPRHRMKHCRFFPKEAGQFFF